MMLLFQGEGEGWLRQAKTHTAEQPSLSDPTQTGVGNPRRNPHKNAASAGTAAQQEQGAILNRLPPRPIRQPFF
jgi:hypothetical protein